MKRPPLTSFRFTAFQRGADSRAQQCIGAALDVGDLVEAKDRLAYLNKTLELRVQERTIELEAADKEQKELMNTATHDLKNPLTAILSSSDILSHHILVSSHRSVPLEVPLFQ
jgi:signal transduction histidine kinase